MKKLTALFCAVILLCGCSGPKNRESAKVAVCWYDREEAGAVKSRAMLETGLREAGYELTVYDARGNQTLQDSQVAELVAAETGLVILEPVMPSAAEIAVEQLKAAEIPVVFVNRMPAQTLLEQISRSCYIGWDMEQAGRLQGEFVKALPDGGDLNGDGEVTYVVIQGPEDHLDVQKITQACAQAAGETARNLAVASGDWTVKSGKDLCASQLSQFGRDIEVIFCGGEFMTRGALEAVEEGGWTPGQDVYLIGMDAEQVLLQDVAEGKIAGVVCRDSAAQTERILTAVQMLLKKAEPEKVQYEDLVPLTQETARESLDN